MNRTIDRTLFVRRPMMCFAACASLAVSSLFAADEAASSDARRTGAKASKPAAAAAQTPKPSWSASASKPAAKPAGKPKAISREREAELLEFVQTHHAELGALLNGLKSSQKREYRAALRDLDRDIRRVEQIRKRSPEQFDTELKLWITRSRIRLLSARLSMSDDEALRGELRDQLRELRQLELASLGQQVAAAKGIIEKQERRLEKLRQRVEELQSDEAAWVEEQLASLEQKQRDADAKTKPNSSQPNAPKSNASEPEASKPSPPKSEASVGP